MPLTIEQLSSILRERGERITKVRRVTLGFFLAAGRPVAADDIGRELAKRGMEVNKTTVYREIDFLLRQQLIRPVLVSAERKQYELAMSSHHHHVVCSECGVVKDIEAASIEDELRRLEQRVGRKIGFAEVRHSLEFFGRCGECQKA